MRKLIVILLLLYSASCAAYFPSITEVRSLYQKAATQEKSCKELIELLSPHNEKNHPLFLGYKACGTMMMAKYAFNPFSKLSYFKKGKTMLAKAIEADEKNVELRFLRFAVQTNTPAFLGYHDYIAKDKVFLLESLAQLTDTNLRELIIPFLKDSGYLTNDEKQKLIL